MKHTFHAFLAFYHGAMHLLPHCRLPLFTWNRFQGTDNHWKYLSPACREGQRSSSTNSRTPWWSSAQVKQQIKSDFPKKAMVITCMKREREGAEARALHNFISHFFLVFWNNFLETEKYTSFHFHCHLKTEDWGSFLSIQSIQSSTFTFIHLK